MNPVLLSSKQNDHGTPREVFEPINRAFRFTVDVCAHEGNHRVPRFWSVEDSGLLHTWKGERCWMNPPYDDLWTWVGKARHESTAHGSDGALTVALLPNRPDDWWHEHVERPEGRLVRSWYCPDSRVAWRCWEGLTVGIHNWPKRIPFVRDGQKSGAPFPSVVVIFAPPPASRRWRTHSKRWTDEGLAPLSWRQPMP